MNKRYYRFQVLAIQQIPLLKSESFAQFQLALDDYSTICLYAINDEYEIKFELQNNTKGVKIADDSIEIDLCNPISKGDVLYSTLVIVKSKNDSDSNWRELCDIIENVDKQEQSSFQKHVPSHDPIDDYETPPSSSNNNSNSNGNGSNKKLLFSTTSTTTTTTTNPQPNTIKIFKTSNSKTEKIHTRDTSLPSSSFLTTPSTTLSSTSQSLRTNNNNNNNKYGRLDENPAYNYFRQQGNTTNQVKFEIDDEQQKVIDRYSSEVSILDSKEVTEKKTKKREADQLENDRATKKQTTLIDSKTIIPIIQKSTLSSRPTPIFTPSSTLGISKPITKISASPSKSNNNNNNNNNSTLDSFVNRTSTSSSSSYSPSSSSSSIYNFQSSRLSSLQSTLKGTKIREQGFRNLGNTCFMNSVLQSFFSSSLIVNDLKNTELDSLYYKKEGRLFPSLMKLLEKKEEQLNEKGFLKSAFDSLSTYRGVDTRNMKDAVDRINPKFKGYYQHDAQEFLLALMDILEEELKEELLDQQKKIKRMKLEKLKKDKLINNIDISDNEKDNSSSDEIEDKCAPNLKELKGINERLLTLCPIQKNFKSIITNIIKCTKCNDISTSKEIFTDISLDILHNNKITYSIQDLLDIYLKEEIIERKCPKCNNNKSTLRKYFSHGPNVLVLHLKRFVQEKNDDITKDKTIILPVDKINLNIKIEQDENQPILSIIENIGNGNENGNGNNNNGNGNGNGNGESDKIDQVNDEMVVDEKIKDKNEEKKDRFESTGYSVYSIIQHIGNGIGSGHYVSYVKQSSTLWKCYDDSEVREVTDDKVKDSLLQNGYLFFYYRDP